MSYLDRGHDGSRDDRARDREGNLILTVAEQREDEARRAVKENEELAAAQLREERVVSLLAQGAEMLDRVIANARVIGQIIDDWGHRIEEWENVDTNMWIHLWFLPGSLDWAWADIDRATRFQHVQDGIAVPFHVSICNDGSGARKLADVILQSQDFTP